MSECTSTHDCYNVYEVSLKSLLICKNVFFAFWPTDNRKGWLDQYTSEIIWWYKKSFFKAL